MPAYSRLPDKKPQIQDLREGIIDPLNKSRAGTPIGGPGASLFSRIAGQLPVPTTVSPHNEGYIHKKPAQRAGDKVQEPAKKMGLVPGISLYTGPFLIQFENKKYKQPYKKPHPESAWANGLGGESKA